MRCPSGGRGSRRGRRVCRSTPTRARARPVTATARTGLLPTRPVVATGRTGRRRPALGLRRRGSRLGSPPAGVARVRSHIRVDLFRPPSREPPRWRHGLTSAPHRPRPRRHRLRQRLMRPCPRHRRPRPIRPRPRRPRPRRPKEHVVSRERRSFVEIAPIKLLCLCKPTTATPPSKVL